MHRTREAPGERDCLLARLRDQLGRWVTPVHRLDRPASGLVVFAFSSEAAREWQARLASPTTVKRYLVLARGEAPEPWTSERPLTGPAGQRQPCRSHFQPLAWVGPPELRLTLLEVRLETGRRHQIRRHLQHAAHHVAGDSRYGKGRTNRELRERYGLPRLFLHAWRLELAPGPRLEAPLAPDLAACLARLPAGDRAERMIRNRQGGQASEASYHSRPQQPVDGTQTA